jgi:uncharacterized repeat protein (TIGR01451 family)
VPRWALALGLGFALAGLALTGLAIEAWAREGMPPEEGRWVAGPGRTTIESPVKITAPGDPLPRIECGVGYTATVYAEGLSSPDGLAFSPTGVLYVVEEQAGRVRRVAPDGSLTTVLSGLQQPEGIAFDDSGSLYVVEDVENGRVIKWTAGVGGTTLATDRDGPEGVVWAPDGTVYITESNVQFAGNYSNFRTHVTAVSSAGGVTRILTNTIAWSYAGIAIGPDGYLYVTNEFSGRVTDDSIFVIDPETGARTLFASGLVVPEGLRFSVGGGFPLYVAEEGVEAGSGRLSQVEADGSRGTLCTGFQHIEDVVLDREGRLYVSEDPTGLVIRIEPTVALSKTASPPHGATVTPGEAITYTLSFSNSSSNDIDGVVLTDTLPTDVRYIPGSAHAPPGFSIAAIPPPAFVFTGTLAAGEKLTASLSVTVSRVISGTLLTNRAGVAAGGRVLATSRTTHRVIGFPSLEIVKAASPPSGSLVRPGEGISYTLTFTNGGTADGVGLVLTDTLPEGVSYVPGSLDAPPEWHVVAMPSSVLVLTGTLLASEAQRVTLGVTVGDVPSGTLLLNQAEITARDADGVTDTTTHQVIAAPELVVSKRGSPPSGSRVGVGDWITYTVTAVNRGGPATDVVVSDTLDLDSVTLVISHTTRGVLSGRNPVRVTGLDLGPGQGVTLTLGVTVSGEVSGTVITNQAGVASQERPSLEVSNPVTHVISGPSFTMAKRADPPGGTSVAPGETITYTVTVVNGGGAASHVVLTDSIPSGVVYVPGSATSTQGEASFEGADLVVRVPRLATGRRLTATLRVIVMTSSDGAITNRVALASDRTGTVMSNPVSHPVEGTGSRYLYLPLILKRFSDAAPAPDQR